MDKITKLGTDIESLFERLEKLPGGRAGEALPIVVGFYEGKYKMDYICIYYSDYSWNLRRHTFSILYFKDDEFRVIQTDPRKLAFREFNYYEVSSLITNLEENSSKDKRYYIIKFVDFLREKLDSFEAKNLELIENEVEWTISVGNLPFQNITIGKKNYE